MRARSLLKRGASRSGKGIPAMEVGLTQPEWCVLGFSEADFWTHAAIDDSFCISYSTGVRVELG